MMMNRFSTFKIVPSGSFAVRLKHYIFLKKKIRVPPRPPDPTRMEPLYTAEKAVEQLKKHAGDDSFYSLCVTLNLDPMRGQFIDSYLDLPHGRGNQIDVAALTSRQELWEPAREAGAKFSGHKEVMDLIVNNQIARKDKPELIIVSKELEKDCLFSAKTPFSKTLKLYQLTPRLDNLTLVDPENLVDTVRRHASSRLTFLKSTKDGTVSTILGKTSSSSVEQILENLCAVMRRLYDVDVKPHKFGNGPRANSRNKSKYILCVSLKSGSQKSKKLEITRLFELAGIVDGTWEPLGPEFLA